jgi:hypothetical protein
MEPRAKVAITLRSELLADVRARVERGEARSVSAFIEHAVEGQLAAEADFDEVAKQLLAATGGPPTRKETRCLPPS